MTASVTLASGTTCIHNISVSASNGTNNTTVCWYNPLYPCSQLSDALNAANNFKTNVCITLLDNVLLSESVTLTNTADIILRGIGHQVIVNCNGQAGLSFLHSNNTYIFNLIFHNCLMKHNSTSFLPTNGTQLQVYCALHFSSCNNVTMIGVDVRYSNATGMTLYDVNGHINIINSSFYGNKPNNKNGGGGLYIEFTYKNPDGYQPPNNISAHYYIANCNFTDNVANVSKENKTLFIKPFKNTHLAFSRGGGISVYFKGNAKNKNILITKCFIIGNRAYWGAGIFAEFQDNSSDNNFTVDSTIIENNENPQLDKNSGTGGGGVRTGFIYYEPNTVQDNVISFRHCQISHNRAYWGGGVSFRTCPEQQVIQASNKLSFINCTLDHNVARLGSGIDVTVWHGLPAGVLSPVIITNCRFLYNNISYTNDNSKLLGKGALYIDTVPVWFNGSKNHFEGNSGSAMAVVSTGVEFLNYTNVLFSNNVGDKGGAIALLGGSWMTIYENTHLSFYNNTATDKGGAIYVMSTGEHDLISSRNCFIRYYNSSVYLFDWNANLTFVDNEAEVAGNSMYVITLLPCIWTKSDAASYNLSEAMKDLFESHPFYFAHSSKKAGNHIATAASHFTVETMAVRVFPGQPKSLPISVTDDKNNDASSYTNFVVVKNNLPSHTVKSKYISDKMIQLYGEPNSLINLTLQTTSTTAYSVQVPVKINHCPPGLCLTNGSTCGCNCNHRAYQGVATCDPILYQSTISPLFWAGYVDNKHIGDDNYFVTAHCPSGFCSVIFHAFSNSDELDKALCQPQNRTGILCGECVANTSVYSSSIVSKCGECTNLQHGKYFGLLQFALYEIVPLIFFFLILIVLNISLTSGPLNGFIFFSQVISSLAAYNHQFTIRHTNIIIFYSFWNLDFLETVLPPYCLMEGWTTLDVFSFHYISAVIPLILVLLVIVMMNHGKKICFPLIHLFRCLYQYLSRPFTCTDNKPIKFLVTLKGKLFNPHSKVLHGLAATLVLSYAKFVSLSFLIIEPSISLHANWPDNISDGNKLRVLVDGTVVYFGDTHIKYAIPATIVIILSILPPLVLFLRPMVHRCIGLEEFLRKWLPLTKIDHFLNEFYACYRPKCQWYASMYFFYRIALFSSNCFTLLTQKYIVQQLLCTAFLVTHSVVQPYTSRLNNCIDGIILAVLLALSCLHDQQFLISHDVIEDHWPYEKIGAVLACIPLLYLICYVLAIMYRHCYTAHSEVYLHVTDDNAEEDFNLEEEHDNMYEESDVHNPPPEINQQHNGLSSPSNIQYQPLHSVVENVSPSDSTSDSPQVSSKYGTFFNQPASHTS